MAQATYFVPLQELMKFTFDVMIVMCFCLFFFDEESVFACFWYVHDYRFSLPCSSVTWFDCFQVTSFFFCFRVAGA